MKPLLAVPLLIVALATVNAEELRKNGTTCQSDIDCNVGLPPCTYYCYENTCRPPGGFGYYCLHPGTAWSPNDCKCGPNSYCATDSYCQSQLPTPDACLYDYECISGTCALVYGQMQCVDNSPNSGGSSSSSDAWYSTPGAIFCWSVGGVILLALVCACICPCVVKYRSNGTVDSVDGEPVMPKTNYGSDADASKASVVVVVPHDPNDQVQHTESGVPYVAQQPF